MKNKHNRASNSKNNEIPKVGERFDSGESAIDGTTSPSRGIKTPSPARQRFGSFDMSLSPSANDGTTSLARTLRTPSPARFSPGSLDGTLTLSPNKRTASPARYKTGSFGIPISPIAAPRVFSSLSQNRNGHLQPQVVRPQYSGFYPYPQRGYNNQQWRGGYAPNPQRGYYYPPQPPYRGHYPQPHYPVHNPQAYRGHSPQANGGRAKSSADLSASEKLARYELHAANEAAAAAAAALTQPFKKRKRQAPKTEEQKQQVLGSVVIF